MPSPPLRTKVAALKRINTYPGESGGVRAVETHFSWLFLTEESVFKLKKPLRGNGVDHRSVASRHRDCLRELRLNRRLAPEIYLGLRRLVETPEGRLVVSGSGRCVDWLLQMRRLPDKRTLEQALAAGQTTRRQAKAIARKLAAFFSAVTKPRISGRAYRTMIVQSIGDAARRLSRRDYGLDRERIRRLARQLRAGLDAQGEQIDARVARGCVIDGHGDLRPEHIYLMPQPVIIDAIEFDQRLRLRDRLDEMAFLALECERAGQPGFARQLLDAYRHCSADNWPPALLDLYKARHAFNRARIAIWHIDDPATGPRKFWRQLAGRYLDLAEASLARMQTHSAALVPATRTPSRT